MIRLTAGNDTPFIWAVKLQGQPFDLSGKDVKVYVINSRGEIPVASINIEGNRVSGVFEGRYQTRLGMHSLALRVNEGRPEMKTATVANAFELVQWSADAGGSEAGDVIFAPVVIISELRIGTGGGGEGGGSYDDTAIWEALNDKVDKVDGKGLSSNDFTDAYVEQLASLDGTYQPKGDYVETKNLATINGKPLNEGGNIEIEGGSGGASIEVDSSLSTTSTNPVQNKVITAELNKKAETGAIPTKMSQLTDNVGFAKQADVEAGYQPKGDYVTDDELSSKGYATEKYVDDALEGKQDTIEDLESIRSGAGKGATAVQPSALANYATTQQLTELSAEVGKKQDTISDLENIRSGAAKGATALQSVPDTYATKTYVNEQLAQSGGQGGGEPSQYIKDASKSADGNTLTLTKKDGSVVSFSPSGGGGGGSTADLTAVAKWGVKSHTLTREGSAETGFRNVVSNPQYGWIPQQFIDQVSDQYAVEFNEVTGYFEYADITNLAYDEVVHSVSLSNGYLVCNNAYQLAYPLTYYIEAIERGQQYDRKFRVLLIPSAYVRGTNNIVARFPLRWKVDVGGRPLYLEIVNYSDLFPLAQTDFRFTGCQGLRKAGNYNLSGVSSDAQKFAYCYSLEEIYLKSLGFNIDIRHSPLLTNECILFMIQNASKTGITITLHPTAYARAEADAAIQEAKANKGVNLAMA